MDESCVSSRACSKPALGDEGRLFSAGHGVPQGGVITSLTQKITFSSSAVFPEVDRSFDATQGVLYLCHIVRSAQAQKAKIPERGISRGLCRFEDRWSALFGMDVLQRRHQQGQMRLCDTRKGIGIGRSLC